MNYLLILILLFYLYFLIQNNYYKIKEPFFLSQKETKEFIEKDPDGFYQSLNTINKKARSHKNYLESPLEFSKELQNRIIKCYQLAIHQLMHKHNLSDFGIEKDKLNQLINNKINFAFTKEQDYEHGLPHTRKNIIFLSTYYFDSYCKDNDTKLINTIIHELTHIYQRYYTKEYNLFLESKGWKQIQQKKHKRYRMNPDLNNNTLWINPNGNICQATYKNDNPLHVDDIEQNSKDEHPYELMAYNIMIH